MYLRLLCKLQLRGGDPALPPFLGVTHICVCPRGSSSKEPGPKRQAGQAQYGEVSPALEKSSQRPDFFQLLPIFPRSSAHIHLILCQSHFIMGRWEGRGFPLKTLKLKRATSNCGSHCSHSSITGLRCVPVDS